MSEIAGSLIGGITLNIKELDGAPAGYPYALKVSNGTLTDNGDGTFTLSTTGSGGTFVDREVPSGSLDDSNVTFTLAHTPIAGSEHVYLNGVLQQSGGTDYTISGATITYGVAPETGALLLVSYRY